MRLISLPAHAVLDYLTGALLIVAPWLFGFAAADAAAWAVLLVGASLLAYSLLTDYQGAALRTIPVRAHLTLDAASGVFLLASPWLFGFADVVAWPHVAFGLLQIVLAVVTKPAPPVRAGAAMATRQHRLPASWFL